MPTFKRCPRCGIEKTTDQYHRNRSTADGLSPHCKACKAADSRRLRERYRHGNGCGASAKITKKCSRCGQEKSVADFSKDSSMKDGFCPICRACKAEVCKRYNGANKEKIFKRQREWKAKNRERRLPGERAYNRKYSQMRRMDIQYRLRTSISSRICASLRGEKAGERWFRLVGYDLNTLKKHIEKQFLPGMSWENYGKDGWHIDHIIPVSVFNFTSYRHIDFKRCWALKNLRPMWAGDNARKGNRLSKPFQPSLPI